MNPLHSVLPMRSVAVAEQVPRTLHFVWVGSPPPPWVRTRWAYWQAFCEAEGHDVEFRFWTDETTQALPLSSELRRYVEQHPVLLSDYVRIEAVACYGGIYVDSDFWPLRSLEPLLDRRGGWAIRLPDVEQGRIKHEVANALFGFAPWHPFLAIVWSTGLARLFNTYKRITSYVGPPVWTSVALDYPGLIDLLPNRLGFPTGPEARDLKGQTVTSVRDAHPDALLWHEYEQSWNPNYTGRLPWRP